MTTLGGILGMPIPTGTPGPAGGVDAGGAPAGVAAADAPDGSSFAGFFDAVVAAASEQGDCVPDPAAAATAPSDAAAGVTPGVILALLGQDVPQVPGTAAPAPGLRARMFRTHDGPDLETMLRPQTGPNGTEETIDLAAAISVSALPSPDPQAAPLGPTPEAGQASAAPRATAAAFQTPGATGRSTNVLPLQSIQAAEFDVTASETPGADVVEAGRTEQVDTAPRSVEPARTSVRPVFAEVERPLAEPAPLSTQTGTSTTPQVADADTAARAIAAPAPRQVAPSAAGQRNLAPDERADGVTDAVAGPAGPSDENTARLQDAARVAGSAHVAVSLMSQPRPERMEARTPEASTGEAETGGAALDGAGFDGATLDRTGTGGGRQSFDAEGGADDARDGDRSDPAVGRQMSVGPQPAAPGAHAAPGQPVTAAEPQPLPSRLAPELGGQVTSQIVQSLRTQLRGGIGEAVVRLRPEFLGEVTITVRLDRGQVDASVKAELPAVREWLEAQEPAVRQSLGDQGLSLTRLRVEPDGQRAFSDDSRQDQPPSNGRHARPRPQRDSEERFELLV